MMTLFQFPISHYCGEARWALEYKGIDYRIKNFVPGPHTAALRKLAPGTSRAFSHQRRQTRTGFRRHHYLP